MQRTAVSCAAAMLAAAIGSALVASSALALDTPVMWKARFSTFKGDLKCAYGDPDCNRCAPNVAAQFNELKSAGYSDFDYSFGVRDSYEPADVEPRQFLSITPGGGNHLQGFARIPIDQSASEGAWFAASYGAGTDDPAVIYLVRAAIGTAGGMVNGDGSMRYIYDAQGIHPGGLHALGHYLIVGHDDDGAGFFTFYDVAEPSQGGAWVQKPSLNNNRSSAAAAAKLAGGGALIVSKRAGSNNGFQLYYANTIERGLPGWQYVDAADGTRPFENVSAITECGTGNIYVVGASGDEPLHDNNYFVLYKLSMASNGAQLQKIDEFTNDQTTNCDARAAGTTYVSQTGNLALYCAQKLGTKARPEALDCVLPWDGDGCSGFQCALDWLQEIFAPGTDCVNIFKIDNEMTFRQYW